MSLWGNIDLANNAPVFGPTGGKGLTANTQALFGNTTFATTNSELGCIGQAIGVFGVDAAEALVTSSHANTSTHAGWIVRTEGTGGRAGRIQTETIVAMGSITGDADDDTTAPDADA
jgi:hypothetical protein